MTLPENKNIGESWEVSAHPNGMSIVENGPLAGKTLQEVYDEYKGKLVGEKVYNEYGQRFPLLIKYLDVNDRLSIQVHPDDEVANRKHNELGKSESWFIMEASDDAVLIMGMKPGITKEVFLEKAKNNDFSGMFEEISVKKGDLIDITPGMVHASLKGSVLFAEIQENSDITYRIYDFDRIENGKKRELHIDDAAEVIDFGKKADITKTEFENGETRKNIIKKKYYSIDKVKVEEKYEYLKDILLSLLLIGIAFIINTGNASQKDVKELVNFIVNVVKEKRNFVLQPEIIFSPGNTSLGTDSPVRAAVFTMLSP